MLGGARAPAGLLGAFCFSLRFFPRASAFGRTVLDFSYLAGSLAPSSASEPESSLPDLLSLESFASFFLLVASGPSTFSFLALLAFNLLAYYSSLSLAVFSDFFFPFSLLSSPSLPSLVVLSAPSSFLSLFDLFSSLLFLPSAWSPAFASES